MELKEEKQPKSLGFMNEELEDQEKGFIDLTKNPEEPKEEKGFIDLTKPKPSPVKKFEQGKFIDLTEKKKTPKEAREEFIAKQPKKNILWKITKVILIIGLIAFLLFFVGRSYGQYVYDKGLEEGTNKLIDLQTETHQVYVRQNGQVVKYNFEVVK